MIVVEGARNKIGKNVLLSVTSSLQTSAGKMIFGKFDSFAAKENNDQSRRPRSRRPAGTST
jgi:hypothetical protein